jgi:predicted nucleic acid-binding protein
MAVKRLLDTNVVLYLLSNLLDETLEPGEYYISVITEIELLSYPALDQATEKQVRSFLSDVSLIELTKDIREKAIGLRREYKLKIADAIILASTMVAGTEFLTNDQRLIKIPGIAIRVPKLKKITSQ